MNRIRHSGTFASALLALLLVAMGLPVGVCATMPDCPMMAAGQMAGMADMAAGGCHRAAADHCALPQVEMDAACDCGISLPTAPAPVPSSDELSVRLAASVVALAPPVVAPAVVEIAPPAPEASPPTLRPSGRSLLSLHQTLLI